MTMVLQKSIICKLGGHINSNPELLASYPPLEETEINSKQLIFNCLPTGCKSGDIITKRYENDNLISYIFSIEKQEGRDDLFSFSILLDKSVNTEIYPAIIEQFVQVLKTYELLKERILVNYQNIIYEGFNEEKDIEMEGNIIELSQSFKKARNKFKKEKPDLKGHFF
ncbi:MAG: hypothetical protein ACQERB_16545 [Promethearchaeati archaeon]